MSDIPDFYIIIQLSISILSLLSGTCQLIIFNFPRLNKTSQVTVISFAILHTFLNLILFGLADHFGAIHIVVLTSCLFVGVLQVIVLGLITRKKETFRYDLSEVV